MLLASWSNGESEPEHSACSKKARPHEVLAMYARGSALLLFRVRFKAKIHTASTPCLPLRPTSTLKTQWLRHLRSRANPSKPVILFNVVFTDRPSKWSQSIGAGLFGLKRIGGRGPDWDARGVEHEGGVEVGLKDSLVYSGYLLALLVGSFLERGAAPAETQNPRA